MRCDSTPPTSEFELSVPAEPECRVSLALHRYGVKMEAITLVQDWIQSVGSVAGLRQSNTNLHSGAVGAAESRLEVSECPGSLMDSV